ncbi:MAG: response regulator [Verrucomicrobiota bacterium]
MLVEDNEEYAETLKKFLDVNGFPTTVIHSDYGLRSRFKEIPPAAMLLDLTLGEVNGIDFMPEIRSHWPKLPIFIIAGNGYEEKMMEYAHEMGAQGFISKSFPQEILAAVTRVLENPNRHRSTDRLPPLEDLEGV